jgi:hypothetical protein
MNIDGLRKFIIEANKAGYSTGDYDRIKIEKDKSNTIRFKSGDFEAHDNFFGGEPYGGRYVIFHKGNSIWMMVYYGKIVESVKEFEPIYKFLQKCLSNMPEELPLRGPKNFESDDFVYENKWEGSLEEFSGKETIYEKGNKIYNASYMGGLVDVKKEKFQLGGGEKE